MRKSIAKIFLSAALVALAALPVMKTQLQVQAAKITGTPTGYAAAENVVYAENEGHLMNWGARGEACTFLSKYADGFYKGDSEYKILSKKSGGTSQAAAPSSELYKALQSTMKNKHSYIIGYQATRWLYCYTDCQRNDYAEITCFYSGKTLSGEWDYGETWNREHTWPNSKGLGGNDENDIMMLRPTAKSENSNRKNTAYGESAGYYDPGESVRGDCARIVLYVYTRWGNTGKMWGSGGVMENLDVLLKWMEEDPVDTWEMGRNDAVQDITGTRNVFVDYPEYAWLLFGEEIPENMVTPSLAARTEEPTDGPADTPTGGETATPPADENSSGGSSEPETPATEKGISFAGCASSAPNAMTAVLALGVCLPAFQKKKRR